MRYSNIRNAKFFRALLICAAALVIASPSYFRTFEVFELATLDLRYKLRPPQPQNKDIAIIEIANDTLEKIGKWPFSREWHVAMIDILSACGAKAIIFDVLFSEAGPHDDAMIASTKAAGNVYYSFSFELARNKKTGLVRPDRIDTSLLPGLAQNCRGYGYINTTPDIDGKTRKILPFMTYNKDLYTHLALLVAGDYLGKDPGDIRLPLDDENMMFVNYAGGWKDSYRHYSFIDIIKSFQLLTAGQAGTVILSDLKGKVCFIGLTATGTHDLNPIPLEERYPSLGIHANLFNTVVTGNFLRRAGRMPNSALLLLLCVVTAVVTARLRPLSGLAFTAALAVIFYIFGCVMFIFGRIWIDLFYPILILIVLYLTLTFYKYVSERQKRQLIEKELEVASKIQRSFLPQEAPAVDCAAITVTMTPAKQVGGDMYDFIELPDGKIGVMVGDVSGKGVPAALYMARAVSLFRIFSHAGAGVKDTLTRLNDALAEESFSNLFVTLTYLVYDPRSSALKYSSGGHLPVILLKKDEEKCRLLEAKEGMPLGLMSCGFSEEEILLGKGDILVLYTDGVTEALSMRHEEYGEERLTQVILRSRGLGAPALRSAIMESVLGFSRSAPQHDDITVIVMEVR